MLLLPADHLLPPQSLRRNVYEIILIHNTLCKVTEKWAQGIIILFIIIITVLFTCHPKLGQNGEAQRELVLEVRDSSEALELTVDHDGESVAQRLALLHAVAGQHHALAPSLDPPNDPPQVPPRHLANTHCVISNKVIILDKVLLPGQRPCSARPGR